MAFRGQSSTSSGHSGHSTKGTTVEGHLREENHLFKELINLLNTRHKECLKLLDMYRKSNEKLMIRLNESENTLNKLEEINCENNLIKLEKQIQSVVHQLGTVFNKQSVHTQTSGESIEKLVQKWTNNKSADNHSAGKYRCDYYGCNQCFTRKDQLDVHLRIHSSVQEAVGTSFETNFLDTLNNKSKSDTIFVPQMELEIIEYNSNPNINAPQLHSYANSTSDADSNSQSRSLIRCDICNKDFNKHYIQSHRRSHSGVKPYQCSYDGCDRTFTQTSSRNYHEKTYHRLDKYSLKCYYNNCEKSFNKQLDLQKHLALHRNESIGSQLLASGGPLIKVVKTRKLRRVPHRAGKHGCPHCGKTFAHKVALRQHRVIHGSKQFTCPIEGCLYASYWKQNLSLHLRRHHNQIPEQE